MGFASVGRFGVAGLVERPVSGEDFGRSGGRKGRMKVEKFDQKG